MSCDAAMKMRVGIVGGAGYTAGELIRLLVNHPHVSLTQVQSASHAGCRIDMVHEGLAGECDLSFVEKIALDEIDILFLCSGHGQSTRFWSETPRPARLKVIDLAQDFRDQTCGYVYGLPELQRQAIVSADSVANPGCFATAIQLALLPLAAAGKLDNAVHVTAITGSTGAGVKPSATSHFSWRDNNLSVYKPFTHQHLAEIRRSLTMLQPSFTADVDFIPVRGDFPRGIFAMVTTETSLTQSDVMKLYGDYYADAKFTHLIDATVDLKQVVNTNKAIMSVTVHENKLLVTCAIDNLLKGASGQAVQNMNLMCGFDERAGLALKASAF